MSSYYLFNVSFLECVGRRKKHATHRRDGCKAGWIAVSKDEGELTYRIANTVCELLSAFPNAERVFIDVPIGLPWRDEPVRPCDRLVS
jgi:predicted RNase H-like nuclease